MKSVVRDSVMFVSVRCRKVMVEHFFFVLWSKSISIEKPPSFIYYKTEKRWACTSSLTVLLFILISFPCILYNQLQCVCDDAQAQWIIRITNIYSITNIFYVFDCIFYCSENDAKMLKLTTFRCMDKSVDALPIILADDLWTLSLPTVPLRAFVVNENVHWERRRWHKCCKTVLQNENMNKKPEKIE